MKSLEIPYKVLWRHHKILWHDRAPHKIPKSGTYEKRTLNKVWKNLVKYSETSSNPFASLELKSSSNFYNFYVEYNLSFVWVWFWYLFSIFQGDSGGPLAQQSESGDWELVGVVSWGIMPCGTIGAPSVFVRTSAYIDWINEQIAWSDLLTTSQRSLDEIFASLSKIFPTLFLDLIIITSKHKTYNLSQLQIILRSLFPKNPMLLFHARIN